MSAAERDCDEHRLTAFLSGDLSSAESLLLEQHLCHCRKCAEQLQMAAVIDDSSWQQTAELLSADEFDGGVSLSSVASITPGVPSPPRTVRTAEMLSREIQGWLDPTDDPQMIGRFAGYEVVGIIGHGGMGIVLKGFESSLNRFVAIKVLAPRLATNEAARKRFAREAQAAAAVLHDNVVAIHRVDEHHGLPFLVMSYNPGISLQKRIDEEGPLPLEAILRIGAQVAAGLAAAHQQGLVHRDIKPANILLERGVERVTITDFGLARAVDDASVTRTGLIAGTPQYMSPEQAQGKALDARSDLFSLGSVIYTMGVGTPPFRGVAGFEIIDRLTDSVAPELPVQDKTPSWLVRIVSRLHALDPNDRFQSAVEVERLLDECLAHLQHPIKNRLPSQLETPPRRVFSAIALIVICCACGLAAAMWWPATPTVGNDRGESMQADDIDSSPSSYGEDLIDSGWVNDASELADSREKAASLEARSEQFWDELPPPNATEKESQE